MKFIIENELISGDLGFGSLPISPNERNGFRPFELFLSSLSGCSGSLLRIILTKKRVPYQRLEMEVDAVRNPYDSNRIEQLSFTALVYTDEPLSSQQAEKIAHIVIKNCGMIQSVIQTIKINFKIKSVSPNGDE
jgi:putative redox protein